MELLTTFILIFFSQNFCFANDESALVSKANILYESGKEEQAKKLYEEALTYALDELLFRANSLELANPQKALDVYYEAKKNNPNLKLYDEKNKLKILKLAVKSSDFYAKAFIKKYNIKNTNSSMFHQI